MEDVIGYLGNVIYPKNCLLKDAVVFNRMAEELEEVLLTTLELYVDEFDIHDIRFTYNPLFRNKNYRQKAERKHEVLSDVEYCYQWTEACEDDFNGWIARKARGQNYYIEFRYSC